MNVRSTALDPGTAPPLIHGMAWPEMCQRKKAFQGDVGRPMLDALWASLCRFDLDTLLRELPNLQYALEQGRDVLLFRAEIAILLAIGHAWRDDPDRALSAAGEQLAHGCNRRFRPALRTLLRYCYWRTRQFHAFYELSQPRSGSAHARTVLSEVLNLSIEAAAEAEQLRFRLAERLAKDARELAALSSGLDAKATLLAICVQAALAYEMGALDQADLLLRGKLPGIEQYGSVECAVLGFAVAAKISRAQGNAKLSAMVLSRGMQLGLARCWPRLLACCAADQIALHLALCEVGAAQALLARAECRVTSLSGNAGLRPTDAAPLDVARQRIALARREHASAIAGLTRLRGLAQTWNHPALVMRLTMMLAAALHQGERSDEARDELLAALAAGADAGAFRTFVDEMPLIERCLRDVRGALGGRLWHLNPYISSLLAVSEGMPEARRASPRPAVGNLLSAKETIILRLISVGLSNKNIARELRIAPETVKSHAKRIFIKLSAKTRAEAVARASEFDLI